jgi:hypothetical protein
MVNDMAKRLVYGVGVNDADYLIADRSTGRQINCNFYVTWHGMLKRCYSANYQNKRPTYKGCTVCSDWLYFSNFKKWMLTQDWVGKSLDKDILKDGNKFYSPENCCFVSLSVNNFTLDGSKEDKSLIGMIWNKKLNKYQARCRNHLAGKVDHVGTFDSIEDAHKAWKKRKHELACQLADMQTDERVANALRTRYL